MMNYTFLKMNQSEAAFVFAKPINFYKKDFEIILIIIFDLYNIDFNIN